MHHPSRSITPETIQLQSKSAASLRKTFIGTKQTRKQSLWQCSGMLRLSLVPYMENWSASQTHVSPGCPQTLLTIHSVTFMVSATFALVRPPRHTQGQCDPRNTFVLCQLSSATSYLCTCAFLVITVCMPPVGLVLAVMF